MKNFLMNYLEKPGEGRPLVNKEPGPVIAISRDCGCSANRIAIKLSKILSGYSYMSETNKGVEWTWVNKEVIERAARELEMDQEKIKHVFMGEVKASIHDVTTAFATNKVYDADDQKVIDTVTEIVYELGKKGNCIIVGRASSVVTRDIALRLSVKLTAPHEWRIKRIMKVSNLSRTDAEAYLEQVDRQRSLFVEHLAGRKIDSSDFDITFNCATMNENMIVEAILSVMKSKMII
jgi:cytidylate kinase